MKLPRTVIALGVVSLLTDVASDMIFPLLPGFLLTLGAGAAYLGLIDGVAESISSLLKIGSGWLSDRLRRRKPLVVFGYTMAALARPLVGFAQVPLQVLAIRLLDRGGKGLRTAPRDALLANATPPAIYGRAFGLHRALDNAGAIVGPAVATVLLAVGVAQRSVFLLTVVPGLLSVALLVFAVREDVATAVPEKRVAPRAAGPLGGSLRRFLFAVGVFTLGNSSDLFLIWHARKLGAPDFTLPLLWMGLNAVKAMGATAGGSFSDRVGRRRAILIGWSVYAAAYAAFAFAPSAPWLAVAMLAYGVYYNFVEGSYGALVADLVAPEARGRAYGLFHGVIGVATLPASVGAGLLYEWLGPRPMFLSGAALAFVAALVLSGVREPNRENRSGSL